MEKTSIDIQKLLDQYRAEIRQIARRHGVSSLRVFGSVARGENTSQSDIDFLYIAGKNTPPWFPAGLKRELEELLGVHVDLVEEDYLLPNLRESVLQEARTL